MSLSSFLTKLLQQKKDCANTTSNSEEPIIFAEVALTNTCNLNCIHCSRLTMSEIGPELDDQTLRRFISQFQAQGGRIICFTGGEPLAKKKFLYSMIELCKSIGVNSTIITNGQLLDEKTVKELQQKGISAIGVSLDGNREFHDHFRARQGSYDRAVQAIKNSVEAGIPTYVMTVPTNEGMQNGNFKHVMGVAESLGATPYINFPTLCGALKDQESWLLSRENLENLYQLGRAGKVRKDVMTKDNGRNCPALRGQIYLSAWGDVCPCPFIQIAFGNIFQQSLTQIKDTIRNSGYLAQTYHSCPPAEDRLFMEKVITPIYESKQIPIPVEQHPHFQKER